MKIYGKPDGDTTAIDYLMSIVDTDLVQAIMHHQRVPIDARACQLPQSLLVQAVMMDNTVVNVRQNQPGGRAFKV